MDVKTVVSVRGQVVIPKLMRETMGIHYGSELVISLREDNVLECKPIQKDLAGFFGMGKEKMQKCVIQKSTDVDDAIADAVIQNNHLS